MGCTIRLTNHFPQGNQTERFIRPRKPESSKCAGFPTFADRHSLSVLWLKDAFSLQSVVSITLSGIVAGWSGHCRRLVGESCRKCLERQKRAACLKKQLFTKKHETYTHLQQELHSTVRLDPAAIELRFVFEKASAIWRPLVCLVFSGAPLSPTAGCFGVFAQIGPGFRGRVGGWMQGAVPSGVPVTSTGILLLGISPGGCLKQDSHFRIPFLEYPKLDSQT